MDRPHASREDTVLFPAFHHTSSGDEDQTLTHQVKPWFEGKLDFAP